MAIKKSLYDTSFEEWRRVLAVNLDGVFLFSKAALPHITQSRGVIINISSSAGKKGRADYSAYSASKFGVIGLTESLAEETKGSGVRVYGVCPSGINTKMHRDIYPEADPKILLQPESVAGRILELILDGSVYPSGSSIEVSKIALTGFKLPA